MLALALTSLACAPSPRPDSAKDSVVQGILSATVYIGTDRDILLGSAVVVRHRQGQKLRLVTADHVVAGIISINAKHGCLNERDPLTSCTRAWMLFGGKARFPLQPILRWEAYDLAVLESPGRMITSGPTAEIASSPPKIGQDVWAVGAPGGLSGFLSRGVLSRISRMWIDDPHPKEEPPLYYFTDADIWFGNSGGGLYSSKGELVGIVQAMHRSGAGLAISYQHVIQLLRAAK